jgi:filamentous hemagglutinin
MAGSTTTTGSFAVRAAVAMLIAQASRAATLPVPCVTGSCGATGPSTFVTSGKASAIASANQLNIQQGSDKAILNWASFNVSADGRVVFQQPSNTSVTLNRIFQGSPSAIYGSIQANGEIYLVNQNGILFGKTAQVNTAGLLASTLNISEDVFNKGLLDPTWLQQRQAVLQSDGRTSVLDLNGNTVTGPDGKPVPVNITVESGAQLTTNGSGQRILLASQQVQNAGTISAPAGQVILAAGEKVYLQASNDPALRGLFVEVDKGGKAWNQLGGQLQAPQGNVSMIGLAVNQEGRISSTTTVSANGSVRLVAADTASIDVDPQGVVTMSPTHGGTLTVGPQSAIDILPDLDDTHTAVKEQEQLPSQVQMTASQIFMRGGAQIHAPGGEVDVLAKVDPTSVLYDAQPSDSRIRIESGVDIDVSGSVAELPVTANLVSVQLRANELANDPTQRDGALRPTSWYEYRRCLGSDCRCSTEHCAADIRGRHGYSEVGGRRSRRSGRFDQRIGRWRKVRRRIRTDYAARYSRSPSR